MEVDIFIVHAAADKGAALRLRSALAALNVTAFVDRPDTPAGQPWDSTVPAALRASLLQVVLIGKETSWYQAEEVNLAINEARRHGADDRVVPVLLDAGVSPTSLPYGLGRLQVQRWDGPNKVAAWLAEKVSALRGSAIVEGKPIAAQRRVRIAVIGLHNELAEALETLRQRIGQRTAILDGEVQRIDLVRDVIPDTDLRVVLLGSRHGGQLALVQELVTMARDDATQANTIVGQIDVVVRKVDPAFRAEAREMADLEVEIAGPAVSSVIDELDERVALWYATRFPARPGRSITREPWEERYLRDKAPLWRKGDPSALRTLGGTRVERLRWYVHLKAELPWIEVDAEVRHRIGTLPLDTGDADLLLTTALPIGVNPTLAVYIPSQLKLPVDVASNPSSPKSKVPWGARHQLPLELNRLRDETEVEGSRGPPLSPRDGAFLQPAWLDSVLSHALLARCVVVGQAGTGKTVLLQHLAWVLSTDDGPATKTDLVHRVDRAGMRGHSPVPPVPILHSATTLVTHLRGDRPIREALVALLRSSETFGDVADPLVVREGIDAGRYVFLIDSLDEVPLQQDRETLVSALGTLRGPTPRVILTTRPSAYTEVELPDGFARIDIAPLDQEAMQRLTSAWVACWAPGEDLDQVLRAVETMSREFPAQNDECAPVENPLLLSCILQVYATYRRLPDDTAKLYHDMVRVLCEAKIRAADDSERDTVVENYREALRTLSLASQELGGTRLGVTVAHERLIDSKLVARGIAENWLKSLANRTGLLRFEGSGDQAVIRPWHRSYQEYLAAEAIALRYANRAKECIAWLCEQRGRRGARLSDPSWQGTLRFLIGAAAHQSRAWGVNLVEALIDSAGTTRPRDRSRILALATRAAAEYSATLFQNEALLQTLPRAVCDAFQRDGRTWPLIDRLDVLDALGRLGDPRLLDPRRDHGVPDPGWVEVPAGVYTVGSNIPAKPSETQPQTRAPTRGSAKRRTVGPTNTDITRRPRVTRTLSVFWIRRWPVTVAEFLPFVDRGSGDLDSLFADPQWAPLVPMWRTQARWPARPIVGVTWYVARAYCAWAQKNWKLPCEGTLDLPTSTEWEIAARGDTDRVYPWGDEAPGVGDDAAAGYAWDHPPPRGGKARSASQNYVVPVCSTPTPVGAFPKGHTPEGLWDLAGNVFEWCASARNRGLERDVPIDKNVNMAGLGLGEMIIRGGGLGRSANQLRITHSHVCGADQHSNAIGFRVVCRSLNVGPP